MSNLRMRNRSSSSVASISTIGDGEGSSTEHRWSTMSRLSSKDILRKSVSNSEVDLPNESTVSVPNAGIDLESIADEFVDGENTFEYPSKSPFYSQERKTRIICAIGPASRSVKVLGQLLDAGMNVARLNFSHGDHKYHAESLCNLREAIKLRNKDGKQCHCAVLLDTKGPEIRTGLLKDRKPIRLLASQKLDITTDYDYEGDQFKIACSYKDLPSSVKKGDLILVADGEITMQVICTDKHKGIVTVRVENSAVLGERKNMNLPGVTIRLPGITEKDRDDLTNFALVHNVDIVSGSFIRTKDNVQAIKDCLGEKGKRIRVHAKIESIEGLLNIKEILQVADGVHISRGDLGMELPLSKLSLVQKAVTQMCNIAGKPVVTSTQMLQSMTILPRPSHAECTDVANAVFDGTDCVMLSGETASGEYPVESVSTMSRIIVEAERCLNYNALYNNTRFKMLEQGNMSILEAMASAAVDTAVVLQSRLIVVVSVTGTMALLVAKYRPWARILVVTDNEQTARQMSRSRGVRSHVLKSTKYPMEVWKQVVEVTKSWKWVHSGDRVIMVDTILDNETDKETEEEPPRNYIGDQMRFDSIKILDVI